MSYACSGASSVACCIMASIGRGVCVKFGRLFLDKSLNAVKYGHVRRLHIASNLQVVTGYHRCHMSTLTGEAKKAMDASSEESVEKASEANNGEKGAMDGQKEDESKLLLEIEKLNKEIGLLADKSKDLDDKYKRALAEGENVRKRLTKQIEDAKLFGIQGFCKDLVEVADILGKATESVPKEEVCDSNPHLKNLYEGLIMTEAQLQQVFKRHGLMPVNPLDEKFDPNLHEALFQQEVNGKEAGIVVVVSKVGYKLHERVIRPALVGVAK